MWRRRTIDGTSTESRAEWKTEQSSLMATASALPRQHQHDGTTIRDEGQRLVGRVEEEHPLHTPEAIRGAAATSDTI